MRGMTEMMTIGERVAFYHRRRGMAQVVLAGLVGRTEDWLSKVENNRIELTITSCSPTPVGAKRPHPENQVQHAARWPEIDVLNRNYY